MGVLGEIFSEYTVHRALPLPDGVLTRCGEFAERPGIRVRRRFAVTRFRLGRHNPVRDRIFDVNEDS